MKIVLWPSLYFPNIGGLEKMVHSLAISLARRNHEILVITNAEKKEQFLIDGIKVFTFPFNKSLFSYRFKEIKEFMKELSAILDDFSPDIVNVHGWYECFSFYQIRILQNRSTPLCITIHGLLEQKNYNTENSLRLWRRAQMVNTVSCSLVLSEPHPHLQTIYNGLPISNKPLQPLPKNRLLLVGRVSEEKCFHIAFYAFKFLQERNADLSLTLIGDGPEYNKLIQLKEALGIVVDMPGFVHPSEIQNYIDASTIILIPSNYESFSLVALEAALRARPVIASRCMGLIEVIEDKKSGLLIEPENSKELAHAIEYLLSNPLEMEQMGKYAYERACSLFNIEITTNKYIEMYEKSSSVCNYSCV